ncbi:MAG TPA: DNA translocase FtsK, partial [Candidatus Woesebacteria bacterium]|nr:DNA translocase FtsK [Candidatus Woesebacteria bacterium]
MGKRRKRSKLPFKLDLKAHTLYTIVGVLLISIGLLVLISFSGQGVWLSSINSFLISKLGLALMFLPFIFISSGLIFLQFKWPAAKPNVLLGTIMIFLGWMSLFRNGEVGLATNQNLGRLLSAAGAVVFSLTLIIVGMVIMAQMKLQEFFELIGILKGKAQPNKETQPVLPNMNNEDKNEKKRFSLPGIKMPQLINKPKFTINPGNAEPDSDQEIKQTKTLKKVTIPPLIEPDEEVGALISSANSSVPTGQNRPWQLPPLSLLDQSDGGEADRGDVSQNADMIEATLDSFGIKAKVKEVNFGPSVTQYALEITRGTKLSKITGLSTDLALALAAPTGQIRIEAPIAGRSLVGIEVPNHTAKFVTLRKMLSSPQMQQNQSKLLVALGIDVANRPYAVDISRMPHMLIAGATGSGKSVALNSFLCSILFRASPDEVRLILVDPKRVELSGYNNIPHLLTPVIVETKQVVSSLKWTTHEMEDRYKRLSAAGVRHIDAYNELA